MSFLAQVESTNTWTFTYTLRTIVSPTKGSIRKQDTNTSNFVDASVASCQSKVLQSDSSDDFHNECEFKDGFPDHFISFNEHTSMTNTTGIGARDGDKDSRDRHVAGADEVGDKEIEAKGDQQQATKNDIRTESSASTAVSFAGFACRFCRYIAISHFCLCISCHTPTCVSVACMHVRIDVNLPLKLYTGTCISCHLP